MPSVYSKALKTIGLLAVSQNERLMAIKLRLKEQASQAPLHDIGRIGRKNKDQEMGFSLRYDPDDFAYDHEPTDHELMLLDMTAESEHKPHKHGHKGQLAKGASVPQQPVVPSSQA
jgi:hypothetical protein